MEPSKGTEGVALFPQADFNPHSRELMTKVAQTVYIVSIWHWT